MTPYESGQLAQERCEHQDAIAEAIYLNGFTDACDRLFPRWNLEDYLSGYLAGIRQLPADGAGRLLPLALNPTPLEIEF